MLAYYAYPLLYFQLNVYLIFIYSRGQRAKRLLAAGFLTLAAVLISAYSQISYIPAAIQVLWYQWGRFSALQR